MSNFPEYTISNAQVTLWINGGEIQWESPEIGFGTITFYEKGDALTIETETLGRDIVEKCLKYILDNAEIKLL